MRAVIYQYWTQTLTFIMLLPPQEWICRHMMLLCMKLLKIVLDIDQNGYLCVQVEELVCLTR